MGSRSKKFDEWSLDIQLHGRRVGGKVEVSWYENDGIRFVANAEAKEGLWPAVHLEDVDVNRLKTRMQAALHGIMDANWEKKIVVRFEPNVEFTNHRIWPELRRRKPVDKHLEQEQYLCAQAGCLMAYEIVEMAPLPDGRTLVRHNWVNRKAHSYSVYEPLNYGEDKSTLVVIAYSEEKVQALNVLVEHFHLLTERVRDFLSEDKLESTITKVLAGRPLLPAPEEIHEP